MTIINFDPYRPAVGDHVLIDHDGFETEQTVRKIDYETMVCTNGWRFELREGEWVGIGRRQESATVKAA